MRLLAPLQGNHPDLVSERIDKPNKCWNVTTLDDHLLLIDRDSVLQIPLPTVYMEDAWGWSLEKSGNFFYKVSVSDVDFNNKHKRSLARREFRWVRLKKRRESLGKNLEV